MTRRLCTKCFMYRECFCVSISFHHTLDLDAVNRFGLGFIATVVVNRRYGFRETTELEKTHEILYKFNLILSIFVVFYPLNSSFTISLSFCPRIHFLDSSLVIRSNVCFVGFLISTCQETKYQFIR